MKISTQYPEIHFRFTFSMMLVFLLVSTGVLAQISVAPMSINVPFDGNGNLMTTEGAALTIWGTVVVVDEDHANVDLDNAAESEVNLEDFPVVEEYALWVEHGVVSKNLRMIDVDQWADYVFEEGYPLPDLTDIDRSMKQTNQLPGFEDLSADSMVSMKEMDTWLLEKIEELTLSVINERHELDALRLQVDDANTEIDADLLKELDELEQKASQLK